MKKYHLLSALAMGTFLAGCTSDELIDKSQQGNIANSDGRISFAQKVGNMTRGSQRAEAADHYEFGVWGYKTDGANKYDAAGDVMSDYLVAYGDNLTGSTNYKGLSPNATTYGEDAKEGTTTVAPDGISTWYYEGLGSPEGSHKEQTTPTAAHIVPKAALQSLKYWDKSFSHTNFFAYMPYYGSQNSEQNVTIGDAAAGTGNGVDMKFTGAGIFYTDPADASGAAQVAANTAWAGTYNPANLVARQSYNKEIINANEANYAAVSRASGDYDKDVPLNFRHVNAKIKVAIWESIPGYKVELIDLINQRVVDNNANISAKYLDCAFTPATKAQAIEHDNHAEKDDNGTKTPAVVTNDKPLPFYPVSGDITAKSVHDLGSTGTERSVMAYTEETNSNANLRFTIASDDATPYTHKSNPHSIISENGQASATVLNTTYYALPNVGQSTSTISRDPITKEYTAAEKYTGNVASNTGYTFHVSYRLLPEDGSAATEVYDARVWVAPEFCRWEDGKQYTYIFKITTSTNGVTNPAAVASDIFEGSGETNPYIDPTDPRVPDNPALVPIVFDGITVEDYETTTGTGHGGIDPNTWQISNVETWPASWYSVYQYRYCNYLTTADVYSGAIALSNEYYSTIPSAPVATFVGAGSAPEYVFQWRDANFKAVTSATVTYTNTQLTNAGTGAHWNTVNNWSASADVTATAQTNMPASKNFATYKMYIWDSNTANSAWEYTATPNVADITITPTLKKEVVEQTYSNRGYMIRNVYNSSTPVTTYYKANAGGTGWDEISASVFETALGSLTPTPDNYKHEYYLTNTWRKNIQCDAEGNAVSPEVATYEKWNSGTSTWETSDQSSFDAAVTTNPAEKTIPADNVSKSYSFEYSYTVASDGYTVNQTTAMPASKQAYGVAKSKWDAAATTSPATLVAGTGGSATLSATFNSTTHTTGTWSTAESYTGVSVSGTTVTVAAAATARTYTFIYTVDGVKVASVDIVVNP